MKARETFRFKDDAAGLESVRFGFFGEVGGLLASVKKAGRDRLEITASEAAGEELGDALWYLFSVAHLLHVSPDEVGSKCLSLLREQFSENDHVTMSTVTFRHIDGLIDAHIERDSIDRSKQLGKLAHSAGVLAEMQHGQVESMPPPQRVLLMGRLMAELSLCCACFSLSTECVALANIEKTSSR